MANEKCCYDCVFCIQSNAPLEVGMQYICIKHKGKHYIENSIDPWDKACEHFGEDILLKNGWICIRTADAYKGIRGYDGKILFITDEQQKFLKENKDNFNEYQLADIEKMLRDFGKLYEWHKED